MTNHIAALALVACFALGGCASNTSPKPTSAASATMLNDKCPFSGEPVNASITSSYKSGKVAFCCAGCKSKWDALSDERKAAMLATTNKAK